MKTSVIEPVETFAFWHANSYKWLFQNLDAKQTQGTNILPECKQARSLMYDVNFLPISSNPHTESLKQILGEDEVFSYRFFVLVQVNFLLIFDWRNIDKLEKIQVGSLYWPQNVVTFWQVYLKPYKNADSTCSSDIKIANRP